MMLDTDRTIAGVSVSRETIEALAAFEALVRRWNPAINLVSKASLPVFWERHVVDSAQLLAFAPTGARRWADLGAGGGFPGLVLAILSRELHPDISFTLVEADQRKATFLRQAVLDLKLAATVLAERIESLPALECEMVSARALAPLDGLLGFAAPHLSKGGVGLFPKGARHKEELAAAKRKWDFEVDIHPSLSDPEAAILIIRNIERAKHT